MPKFNIDVRAFYNEQDIPQPKMTKGEMAYLLHSSKYPRVQLPRDRRYLHDPYFPVRSLLHFFDSLRCYMQTCSTPDSGIELNEQLDEENEQKKKKISLAPGPDTVYFAGKHGHLVRRREDDDKNGDIPLGGPFWLDS